MEAVSSELFLESALATRTTGMLSRVADNDSWLLSKVPKNFLMLLPPGDGRGLRRVARTLLGDVLVVDDADDDSEGGGGGSAAFI